MDFVDGRNLSQLCQDRPMEAKRAARYLLKVAGAVHFAHERGILHRDIKPSNVLIDREGNPRVTDFGLAKRLVGGTELTVTGDFIGSPGYASPEQASGRETQSDARTDVYSIGALLYYLLTGRPPFAGSSIPETLRLVAETDPVPPRLLNPSTPEDLETICLKCLEKDPHRRYPTAKAVGDDLGRFLEGRPIVARPISRMEHVWRWCRRHPAMAAMILMVVTSLSASTLISYSAMRRIEEDRYATAMRHAAFGLSTAAGVPPHEMRRWLDDLRPRRGHRDLRGFEWRYYWTTARSDAEGVLGNHDHVVDAVAASPDGQGFDGTVRQWALEGGPPVVFDGNFRFKDWQIDPLSTKERVAILADRFAEASTCRTCEISSTRDSVTAGTMASATTMSVAGEGRTVCFELPSGRVEICATEQDATWASLLPTPPHPEYISAHVTLFTAMLGVAERLPGHSGPVELSTTNTGESRVYESFGAILDATIEGRVLIGYHFRQTGLVSRVVGEEIADYIVDHALLPSHGNGGH